MTRNKLRTPSYFTKRLRDNGFIVVKIFSVFGKHDPRRWTILVNPSEASVFITCFFNKDDNNEVLFELNDGGARIPKNFSLKTDSIEVVVDYLIRHGVSNGVDYIGRSRYLKERLNNVSERQEIS